MDPDKLNNKVLQVFQSFLTDIMTVYPEHRDKLSSEYEELLGVEQIVINDNEQLKLFMKIINENNKKITNKDESVFDTMNLLKPIDIKELWGAKNITNKIKQSIWKYLQTFCVISIHLESSENLRKLLSGESTEIDENKKDLKQLKTLKKLKENIEEEPENVVDPGLENMIENSSIGKLAKEIAEDLNIDELTGDPSDMANMFQNENFMNIFSKINSKVQDKMNSGELDGNILSKEASSMYPDISSNPIFGQLFNNPDIQRAMHQQMSQSQEANTGTDILLNSENIAKK